MKKVIPQKIVNVVYGKLLVGKRLEHCRTWTWDKGWVWHDNYWEDVFYKPDTNEISNKFFKNKVSRFIYIDKDDWWLSNKTISTKKRINKWENDLNDYIQEQ